MKNLKNLKRKLWKKMDKIHRENILSHFDDDGGYKACKGCNKDCSICIYGFLNDSLIIYLQEGFTPREITEFYIEYGDIDTISKIYADLLMPYE